MIFIFVYKLAKLESKYNMREYINLNHIRPLKGKSQIMNIFGLLLLSTDLTRWTTFNWWSRLQVFINDYLLDVTVYWQSRVVCGKEQNK